MQKASDLIEKALKVKKAADWSRLLDTDPANIAIAKRTGRVSPVLAGNLAIELGEDPAYWMMIAALETERKSDLLTRLQSRVNNWRKRWLKNNTRSYFNELLPGFVTL